MVTATPIAVAQGFSVNDGNFTLSVTESAPGMDALTISGSNGGGVVAQVALTPVQILVCPPTAPGSTVCAPLPTGAEQPVLLGSYGAPQPQGPSSIAFDALVTSPAGSKFAVHDVYAIGSVPSTATLTRTVTVTAVAAADLGFNSAFQMGFSSPPPFASTAFFAPGIWYNNNAWAPATAFGTFGGPNGTAQNSFWRETRSGAPMLAMQDEANGLTLALAHIGSLPEVGADSEQSPNWQVGPGIRYGSLGVSKQPATTIGFIYPADEGEGSYVPGSPAGGWVRRSNPVTVGFQHSYTLLLSLDDYAPGGVPSFTAMMSGTWRKFFPAFGPQPQTAPIDQIFVDGVTLLSAESKRYGSAQGFPFAIDTTQPASKSLAFQMGYTGMEIPGAFQMFRAGVLSGDSTLQTKGQIQLSFWATDAVRHDNAPGLPDDIYNVSGAAAGWSNNNNSEKANPTDCKPILFLSLTDGMLGMLNAAVFGREHSAPDARWESFAQQFGNWLLKIQNSDGSFFREYNPDGKVFVASTNCAGFGVGDNQRSTPDAIPFLVGLYKATGNPYYLQAAERAGQYALANIYGPAIYAGGISSSSPNGEPLIDRGAGEQAMHAALALYDVTGDATWLAAAREAADYTETWMYIQNSVLSHPSAALAVAGTRAYSLVALTGQVSTADIGLSIESYDYYRLHLLGDDAANHYLQVALLLENNSKLTTELGAGSAQSYGYFAPGVVGEADDVSYLSYVQSQANMHWLPWETEAEVEPVQRMQDTFGASTIEAAQVQSPGQLASENAAIYPATPFANWGQ